ncbi:MAG: PrpR N-terminal domain-containing protein [Blautia sp.]|nr:PrpR N-terminal domain-containing protein [Blautia sp.]
MAKIGILFPYKEIEDMARALVSEEKIEIEYMKTTNSTDVLSDARKAIEAGVDIIISRGYQAMVLKNYINIPIIEMKIQIQEIGMLIKKAKRMIPKENLKIAMICFSNMLNNMDRLGELLDVELKIVYISKLEEAIEEIRKLKETGVDLIIGGATTVSSANMLGLPGLQYVGTEDMIIEAVEEANRLQHALELENRSEAQLESILDTTFNGIIKINSEGTIIVVNRLVENLISMGAEDVIGKSVRDIFPEFDEKYINAILSGEKEHFIISVNIRNHAWILNMAPIQYNDTITGAILSLQKMNDAVRTYSESGKRLVKNGYTVSTVFGDIKTQDPQFEKQLELAKKYALSDCPVIIYSEHGTEYFQVAEAIHNGSVRKSSPFLRVDLETMNEECQMRMLFGKNPDGTDNEEPTVLVKAYTGTLFLNSIERLEPRAQNMLLNILLDQSARKTAVSMMDLCQARIIVSTKVNLKRMVEEGLFNAELFYLLQGLVLVVPPLRERKADLRAYFEYWFAKNCKRYNKYLVLTAGAVKKIEDLPWNGNLLQIRTFCESLVIRTDRRKVDEIQIQELYNELYPIIKDIEGRKQVVIYKAPEAEEISRLLDQYYGNRSAVANELGISTTTLWRKMKKYGISGAKS